MSTNKVNWAQRGKEAVQAAATKATFQAPEGFKQTVTGGEGNAELFIRYSPPRERAINDNELLVGPGFSLTGKYTQLFQSKDKKATYYKVQVTDSTEPTIIGKLVALSDATILRNGLTDALGKEVFIGYQGKGEAKNGKSAPHVFFVAAK